MKTISRTRKCAGYLALAIVLLVAADRYYPAVMCALGIDASDQKAGVDIVAAARSQIGVTVKYAPAYEAIECPGGDVPRGRGVCTDVLIRALRDSRGIDLQPLIYRDMKWHRWAYPLKSIFQAVDASIVHRRVLNMECYFRRHGWTVASNAVGDFLPGDIVNCLVTGNTVGTFVDDGAVPTRQLGLGVYAAGAAKIINTTVIGNTYSGSESDHLYGLAVDSANVKVQNCVILDNGIVGGKIAYAKHLRSTKNSEDPLFLANIKKSGKKMKKSRLYM